jgi:hypothetical protein
MKKCIFCWLAIVILTCGLGAAIYFWDGWVRIATLVVVAILLAFLCAYADFATKDLDYEDQQKKVKILYLATAVIATWPLLACVMINYVNLAAVATTTISLIGVSIRRALQN